MGIKGAVNGSTACINGSRSEGRPAPERETTRFQYGIIASINAITTPICGIMPSIHSSVSSISGITACINGSRWEGRPAAERETTRHSDATIP
eukprot:787106-Rhodomonas_salina.1